MKKIVLFISMIFFIIGCSTNKNSKNQILGNDVINKCKPSTGYQWSKLEKKCIRPFEEGVKIKSVNNYTYAAYIIYKNDKLELFSKETTPSIILNKQKENIWKKGDWKVEFLNKIYTVKNKNIILYQN